jgi:hypothetical protein
MPQWVLGCPHCKKDFDYREVAEGQHADPSGWTALKPGFPPNGLPLECPHCKEKSVFQHDQLTYRVRPFG